MANDYMDYFDLNGVHVNIQDYGRDQPNGVPVLDPQGKLPLRYLPQSYADNLKTSPEDPYNMSLTDWAAALSSYDYRYRGRIWTQGTGSICCGSIAYNGEIFVGLSSKSSDKRAVWSEDGKTWHDGTGYTSYSSSSGFGYNLDLKFGNNIWVAGGSSGVFWSEDGKNWTQGTGILTTQSAHNVTYANNLFICCVHNDGAYWSENGKDWTKCTGALFDAYNVRYPSYANGFWTCSGNSPAWSIDGKDWQASVGLSTSTNWTIIFSNNMWFALSAAPLMYSTDGKNWYQCSGIPTLSTGIIIPTMITFGKGVWVLGLDVNYYWSADGINWSVGTVSSPKQMYTIVFAENMFVAGTSYGVVYSLDGKNWVAAISGNYAQIVYANSLWLAFGANNKIAWSENGAQWQEGTGLESGAYYQNICISDDIITAASDYSSGFTGLLWAPNKTVWTPEIE